MQKALYPDYKSYGIWKEKIPVPKMQKQQSEAADYLLWDHNLQKELEAGVENLHSQVTDHFYQESAEDPGREPVGAYFLTDNFQKKAKKKLDSWMLFIYKDRSSWRERPGLKEWIL